jgi:hypothetical protein
MSTGRRALVLDDKPTRHPFLASLPSHVRKPASLLRQRQDRASWWREFLMAYCACFLVVSIFIA